MGFLMRLQAVLNQVRAEAVTQTATDQWGFSKNTNHCLKLRCHRGGVFRCKSGDSDRWVTGMA